MHVVTLGVIGEVCFFYEFGSLLHICDKVYEEQ